MHQGGRASTAASLTCWGLAGTLLACFVLWSVRVEAQAPARVYCEPPCRSGYRCELGECIPQCEPPCGEGLVCAAGGQCLPEGASALTPALPSATSARECRPACRSSYVCIDGSCVSRCNPPCPASQVCAPDGECVLAPRETRAVIQPPMRSPSADSKINLHLNLLDPLQFGLAPTLELGTWISLYVRAHVLNTGLLSYLLLPENDEGVFLWGLGGTVGLHVFSARDGNMRGLFGGVALGYVFVKTRDARTDLATFATHSLVPQLDVGYRWVFGHFLLGLGGRVGLAIPIAASDKAIGPTGCARPGSCDGERSWLVPASLVLDLGWFI